MEAKEKNADVMPINFIYKRGQQIKFDFFGIHLALLSSIEFSRIVGVLCLMAWA